ncbi:MAG: hypothetical protein ACRC3B_16935, partial [Bacteroidia bacterium]
KLYGVSGHLPFRLVGIGLLGFAALLYLVRKNAEKRYVIMIILADIGWVIGSVLIIYFDPFYFTEAGMWITSLLAATVLWIAALQLIALTKANRAKQ